MTLPSSVTCLTSSFNSLCMPPVPASLAFVLPFGQPSPLLPQDLYTRCFPFSEVLSFEIDHECLPHLPSNSLLSEAYFDHHI